MKTKKDKKTKNWLDPSDIRLMTGFIIYHRILHQKMESILIHSMEGIPKSKMKQLIDDFKDRHSQQDQSL